MYYLNKFKHIATKGLLTRDGIVVITNDNTNVIINVYPLSLSKKSKNCVKCLVAHVKSKRFINKLIKYYGATHNYYDFNKVITGNYTFILHENEEYKLNSGINRTVIKNFMKLTSYHDLIRIHDEIKRNCV